MRSPCADPPPYVAQLREGWTFLRGDRLLLGIAVMVALTNLLDAAWSSVLMPVWAVDSGAGAAVARPALRGLQRLLGARGACAAACGRRGCRATAIYLVAFLVTGLPRFAGPRLRRRRSSASWSVFVAGGFASGFLNPSSARSSSSGSPAR